MNAELLTIGALMLVSLGAILATYAHYSTKGYRRSLREEDEAIHYHAPETPPELSSKSRRPRRRNYKC